MRERQERSRERENVAMSLTPNPFRVRGATAMGLSLGQRLSRAAPSGVRFAALATETATERGSERVIAECRDVVERCMVVVGSDGEFDERAGAVRAGDEGARLRHHAAAAARAPSAPARRGARPLASASASAPAPCKSRHPRTKFFQRNFQYWNIIARFCINFF
jgi:hypothetical protein